MITVDHPAPPPTPNDSPRQARVVNAQLLSWNVRFPDVEHGQTAITTLPLIPVRGQIVQQSSRRDSLLAIVSCPRAVRRPNTPTVSAVYAECSRETPRIDRGRHVRIAMRTRPRRAPCVVLEGESTMVLYQTEMTMGPRSPAALVKRMGPAALHTRGPGTLAGLSTYVVYSWYRLCRLTVGLCAAR